jgi:pimeloyl-ACP methyl ester carboxylesterase
MVKEVRSPWNSTHDMPNAQRGISPGAYSNPSNSRQRADGGHLVRSPGKGGGPASVRRDSTPVVGGLRAFSSGFRLWRLCARTLVVTGTEDQLVPPGNSRILASAIPNARLETLPGLGHRAIWEAPEEMADLVSDFLTIRELSPAGLSLR